VLNALREVEDALVAYRTDRAGRNKLAEAVRSGERALYLARDSYTQGLADFIQVLDPERTLIGSRRQLVQTDVMLTDDVVSLYDALGGGWQETAPPASSHRPWIPPPRPWSRPRWTAWQPPRRASPKPHSSAALRCYDLQSPRRSLR
jgi:multidrug efflux system outer membrane protein